MNAHGVNISYPDYVSWRDENRTFSALGMYTWTTHTIVAGGEAEHVDGASVTANLFPLLGVSPRIGRPFTAAEERPGNDRVVLISDALWRRRFGGDSAVVGRAITVDDLPYVLVGVMPPRFNFPERADAWVPFAVDRAREGRGNRGYAGAIGRLGPGVSLGEAQADLARLSARLRRDYPVDNFGWAAEAISLREDLTGDLRRPLLVFLGAVAFVLLIACANVGNLMLARTATRQREFAVRVAVGAGRGRLIRQVLIESLVLAGIGGLLGAALAAWGVGLIRFIFPSTVPFYISLGFDRTALLIALGLSALTGSAFGIVPALRAPRIDLNATLREGTRGSDGGRGRSRLRGALVVVEIALSVVLLVGATLLIRSYRALERTDLGFNDRRVLSVRLALPEATYGQRARRQAFYDALFARLGALPGVQVVGSAQGIPFSGWDVQAEMAVEGRPAPKPGEGLHARFQWVSPEFFHAIGVPLVRGRAFTPFDRDSAAPVGLINETLARLLAVADPVGIRMKIGTPTSPDPWVTVVGVVADYHHYRLPRPVGPAIYFPYATSPTLSQTLTIRTSLDDPLVLTPLVGAALRKVDPQIAMFGVQTLGQAVSRSLWRQRLQGQVLGAFAGLALLLAIVGLYGVISYVVARRTHELGVRVALGATRGHVLGMIVWQGVRLAAIGSAFGIGGALALTRVLSGLLYGVQPLDPATFVSAPLVLSVAAVLASAVPARRATRADPLEALRSE
jgi:putative ABC transport system permease protein